MFFRKAVGETLGPWDGTWPNEVWNWHDISSVVTSCNWGRIICCCGSSVLPHSSPIECDVGLAFILGVEAFFGLQGPRNSLHSWACRDGRGARVCPDALCSVPRHLHARDQATHVLPAFLKQGNHRHAIQEFRD